jgi:hypothetical protein
MRGIKKAHIDETAAKTWPPMKNNDGNALRIAILGIP